MSRFLTRRWTAPAAAAVLVTAVLAAAVVLHRSADTSAGTSAGSRPQQTPAPAVVSPSAPVSAPPTTVVPPVADAQTFLLRLADNLRPAPTDGRRGAFEYVSSRVTERTGPLTAVGPTGDPAVWQIMSWTSTRASGRSALYDIPGTVPVCPATSDQTWDEPHPQDGALGRTPAAVLDRLIEPGTPRATRTDFHGIDLFGQIGDLITTRILPRDTRAAMLKMLAAQPDIEVRADVRDATGRPGIAISTVLLTPLGPSLLQRTLIVDPNTGEFLATERQFQVTDASATPTAIVAGPRSGLREGLLITDRAYTSDIHTPASPCAADPGAGSAA